MGSYKTIEGFAESEIVEKKSRFIAHLCHVGSEQEALEYLQRIRGENQQARHNVYAYLLRGGRARYSDDGEPAQTSGLPTYEVLEHAGLEDVICVTTRYFGGVLLGTGGLVRAYTQAAQSAIKAAHIVEVSICRDVNVTLPYSLYSQAERIALENPDVRVMSSDFASDVKMVYRVKDGDEASLVDRLSELTRGQAPIIVGDPVEAIF